MVVRRRARALFDCLDRDGNGTLELSDLTVVAARLERIAPELVRVEVARAWSQLFRQLQEVSGDGPRVRADTFVDFFERAARHVTERGDVPMEAMVHLDATLDALDLDGDGRISAPEYAAYITAIGSSADGVDAFVRLDPGGEGSLDLRLLAELFAEWLTGDDDTRGAVLLTGHA